jgi:hypothetical protein
MISMILVVVSIVMVDSQPYGNWLGVLVGLPNKELSPTVRRNLLSNIQPPANKLLSQNIIRARRARYIPQKIK